jgi:hypothetical protein
MPQRQICAFFSARVTTKSLGGHFVVDFFAATQGAMTR